MDQKAVSSLAFASFVADISDPGTGEILQSRLAGHLGMTEECLLQDWHASGVSEWKDFAEHVLALLDAIQDITMDLPSTMTWYRTKVVVERPGWTPAECVTRGAFREALVALNQLRHRSRTGSSSI